MRVVSALSGELLAEAEVSDDLARAASDALRIPRELLRVTECAVVVLPGKALCRHCRIWIWCTCSATTGRECRCTDAVESVCDACQDRLKAEEAAEDAYQAAKEADW